MNRTARFIAVAVLVLGASIGTATPVQWPIADGGNNHYYDLVMDVAGVTWSEAKAAAEHPDHAYQGVLGHLATLTSPEENAFVTTNFLVDASSYRVWLGGHQPEGTEPADGWEWITGEPWVFTNWDADQPDDASGEDYLEVWAGDVVGHEVGTWNDSDQTSSNQLYLVEYPSPPIPAVSEWGLLVMALLGLAAGTIMFRRARRRAVTN